MGQPGVLSDLPRSRLLAALVVVVVLTGAGVGAIAGGPALTGGVSPPPGIGGAAPPDADIDVVATDPADVRDANGDAGVVSGRLGGTLTLREDVDRVEFVVQTRLPDGTWTVIGRASAAPVPGGRLDLGPVVGGATTFLDATQSDGFDVDTPGSVATREGAVAVTARLYVAGDLRGTVTGVDTYAFRVDRPAPTTLSVGPGSPATGSDAPGGDGGFDPESPQSDGQRGGGTPDDDRRGMQSTGAPASESGGGPAPEAPDAAPGTVTTALFGAADVVPGSSGTASEPLTSPRPEMESLRVTVGTAVDDENGRTEPEMAIDRTPGSGELSAHLDVRILLVRESGQQRYVVGGPGSFVPLAAAIGASESIPIADAEDVTLVVEWRISPAAGNEIQTDGTSLTIHCEFTSA